MSILQKIENENLTWTDYLYKDEILKKEVISKKIQEFLYKIFIEIERKDETCDIILMNKDDYKIVRKYLTEKDNFEEIHQYSILKTGRFAIFCGALIIVGEMAKEPVGFSDKNDLPKWLMERFGLICGQERAILSRNLNPLSGSI